MDEKPNYFAIIPANVRYDNELKAIEKLLYGEITTLTHKTGECWASNNYFAKLYNIYPTTISKYLNHLKNKGYIDIKMEYVENSKEIDKRKICIAQMNNTYCSNEQEGYSQISKGGIAHTSKENNTSINNTSINNKEIYKEIIDYLNLKLKTHYKDTTPKTQSLINARLKEGFSVDDFKKVIDTKYDDWYRDKKMFTYLRPETLFSNKFENYLNQRKEQGDSREEILNYLKEMNKNEN